MRSRENLSAASFAIAILCSLTDPPLLSVLFFYLLFFLYLGYRWAPRKIHLSTEVRLCTLIIISMVAAIPVSFFIQDRLPLATAFQAAFILLLFPMVWLTDVRRIFFALVPVAYLQAGVMAYQWFIEGLRAGGIASTNDNAGASLLLTVSIFLLNQPRCRWLAMPLLGVLPMSGSRWTMIVAAVILGGLLITGNVKWRHAAALGVIAVGLLVFQWSQIQAAYRLNYSEVGPVAIHGEDSGKRLESPVPLLSPWILVPQGFIDSQLHSVPLRATVESGLLAGLAWVGAGFVGLWRKPRLDWSWWCLAATMLLSVMYYFPLIAVGFMWWMTVNRSQRA